MVLSRSLVAQTNAIPLADSAISRKRKDDVDVGVGVGFCDGE